MKRPAYRRMALVFALSVLVAACLVWGGGAPAYAAPEEGGPAPAFSGTTIDGQSVSLETFSGKPLVLLFWGSW
jgi:cytochrome c biogenesis protein CcmG/thiol:disulfide interchange protein DsbE